MTDQIAAHPAGGPTTDHAPVDAAAALSERLFASLLGGMELLSVELGLSLGLYEALAAAALTAGELAAQLGLDPRYVREWVEQQAAADVVEVDTPDADAGRRRYRLPSAHAQVLLDPVSPYHLAPAGPLLVGLGRTTPAVRDAFRTGEGVAYGDYGREIREGIAAFNRPMVTNELAASWLPAMGAAHDELVGARALEVLDLGCGTGWSSVALARAYPQAVVRGLDLDQATVDAARANAAAAGVADRVRFTRADAAAYQPQARMDLVTCFEALHDMADPVAALRMARGALRDGGHLLVADERTAEAFTAPGDEVERFLYAFSVLHCLPATRAEPGPVAHGTMARATDVLGWFDAAGFDQPRVLDVDNDMWRFYLARR